MGVHFDENQEHLSFPPDIQRDVFAIVVAVLQDQPVEDLPLIIGDEARLPALLLQACHDIVELSMYLEVYQGAGEDHAADAALDRYQNALLKIAAGTGSPYREGGHEHDDG